MSDQRPVAPAPFPTSASGSPASPPGFRVRPAARGRTWLGDLTLLCWAVIWAIAGVVVHRLVASLAGPAQSVVNASHQIESASSNAAQNVGQIPAIGHTIASPFDAITGQAANIATAAQEQITLIHQLSWALGIVTFLAPVATVALLWVPRRVRRLREVRSTQLMLDADADLDLFALRAMTRLPVAELARISPDPVGDWRRRDASVITQLARTELRHIGVELLPK